MSQLEVFAPVPRSLFLQPQPLLPYDGLTEQSPWQVKFLRNKKPVTPHI